LKTVATSINKHEVMAMRSFAEEELGVEFKMDGQINPRIDCSQSPLAVRLTPEEVVALDMSGPKECEEYLKLAQNALSPPFSQVDTVYSCGAGMNSFAINPYGELSLCITSQQETFRLRTHGIRNVWEGALSKLRAQKRSQITKCLRCRIQPMCGMCPANGELENGDREAPVDHLCHVAHLRAAVLGVAVPEHGKCEFCCGGSHYEEVLQGAHRIRANKVDFGSRTPTQGVLPILNNSTGYRMACGSCTGH
jgi:radical SAM protein with 4Fe4S-binding SPASM domain